MEDNKLETALQAYKNQTGETWLMNVMELNMSLLETIQTQKARAKLKRLAAFKIFAIVLGIVWILFLAMLVYYNNFKNIYFGVSISMILLFNVIAVAVYIKQVFMIRQINYSDSVTGTQEKLAALQLSTLNIVRVLFLQMPFYCTWFWSPSWINFTDIKNWLITFPITIFFIVLSVWLYKNIAFKNVNKKWFKILFGNIEWTAITQSMEFIKVIDDFKKED
ncbi:MAG: hypothetical protein ABUT20_03025 [Bacteroidota bacterium]